MPHRNNSNTYTVQGRFSRENLERLLIHDRMFTSAMGGVLPEQADPTQIRRVLDIGCGPGGWLIEVAKAYPNLSQLVGVDINEKMINYAQAQAQTSQLDDRVAFRQMDGLRPLDFPDAHFDLINERFGMTWLRTWEWPHFLQECQRVVRPGGVVRTTEFQIVVETNSVALTKLGHLSVQAFYRSGHLFAEESTGLTKELSHLMRRYGLQDVQTRAYALHYRAGTPLGQLFVEDWTRLFRVVEPFLRKWTNVGDDYEGLYKQMLEEMRAPDFFAVTHLHTVWGVRSSCYTSFSDRP